MITVAAAMDFGTSNSGYGWVEVTERNDDPALRQIHTCLQWPGQVFPYAKTLTALLLDREGRTAAWGYEAHRRWRELQLAGRDRGWRPARFFKLGLLSRHDTAGAFTRPAVLLEIGTAPEHLIAAYLSELYRHALAAISRSGHREDEIRWCVTVPAQWTDQQKQVMRRAAAAAGMPDGANCLILALEPEAAAHHARVSGVKRAGEEGGPAPSLMRPGARFMVVDCGGGTVDLTAYRNDDDGLMVEIGKVSGGALGSQCLNAAFAETVLVKRFGGPEEVKVLERKCPVELDDLLDRWERAKLHIGVDHDEPFLLPLTSGLERRLSKAARNCLRDQPGGRSGHIVVTPAEVHDIFAQVIPHILGLVDRQLIEMRDQAGAPEGPELVLLAGGFAASPYLRQRMQDHLAGRAELLTVPDPGVAVLSGAVHFAYAPQTRARRSRFTYGIATSMPFEDGTDPGELKATDAWGKEVCTGRFGVFVTAGHTVASGEEISNNYLPLHGSQARIDVEFYASTHQNPRYVTDPGCRRIGTVKVSLKDVLHLDLTRRGITVTMRFGETEIRSDVTVTETEQKLHHALDFEEQ